MKTNNLIKLGVKVSNLIFKINYTKFYELNIKTNNNHLAYDYFTEPCFCQVQLNY